MTQGHSIVTVNGKPKVEGNYFVRAILFLNEKIKKNEQCECFDSRPTVLFHIPCQLIYKNKKYAFYCFSRFYFNMFSFCLNLQPLQH